MLPSAPSGRGLTRSQKLRRRVGFALAGAGLVEVKNWPFVGPADFDRLGLPEDDVRRDTDPDGQPAVRAEAGAHHDAAPGAAGHRGPQRRPGPVGSVAIYETAPVFVPTPERLKAPILGVDWRPDDADLAKLLAAVPRQPLTLGVVLAGDREASGWWGAGRPVSWADAVQVVREVARVLARRGGGRPGHPGALAPRPLRASCASTAWSSGTPASCTRPCARPTALPARTSAVEVDLELLIDRAPLAVEPEPFSTYPVAKEDVAFELDAAVPAEAVVRVIREAAGELLESVRVFDLYTGAPIPAGRKSLAFALRFRAPDRTLTEAETAQARDAAVARVVAELGAVHRA